MPWGTEFDDAMRLQSVAPGSIAASSQEVHACLGMVLAAVDDTEVCGLDEAIAVTDDSLRIELHFQCPSTSLRSLGQCSMFT
eukprot:gene16180-biopygen10991